ncbi:MAG: hypothetical protein QF410_00555 [Planctomycetota bacterium]|nr:hypothetical protein [Planctomycetota bacterium]
MKRDHIDAQPLPEETLELLERTLRADLAAVTPPPPGGLRERVLADLPARRPLRRRALAVAAGLLLALSASLVLAHLISRADEAVEPPLSVARLIPDMGELLQREVGRGQSGLAEPLLREVELLAEDTDRVATAFLRSLPAPILKGLPAGMSERVSPR